MLPVILLLQLVSIGRLVSYPHPSNQRDFPSCCWLVQATLSSTPHPPTAVAPFCCGTDSMDTHFSDAINIKIGDRRAIYFTLHNIRSVYITKDMKLCFLLCLLFSTPIEFSVKSQNVLLRTTHAYLQNTL